MSAAVSSNLVISESSVAFVFASATHPDAAVLACKLARAAGDRDGGVVLVGMGTADQHWTTTASLYGVRSGRLLRGGYIVLGSASTRRRISALARFITKGIHDPDVIVTAEVDPSVSAPTKLDTSTAAAPRPAPDPAVSIPDGPASAANPGSWHPWAAAGGATFALAMGSYALYRHYTCGTDEDLCKYTYSRAGMVGYAATGMGVALGALATYWFVHGARDASAANVTITPSRSGAMVGWAREF